MNGPLVFIGTLLLILLFFALWVVVTSNQLIMKRNRVKQRRNDICVALKQRNDLIPNLVATVKSYTDHENRTLDQIVALRNQANDTTDETRQIETGNRLSALLPHLQLNVEAYPDLKADQHYLNLQASLEKMERQLQATLYTYNAVVTEYNNYVELFPSSWVAHRKGHRPEALIEIPDPEQNVPDIKHLLN